MFKGVVSETKKCFTRAYYYYLELNKLAVLIKIVIFLTTKVMLVWASVECGKGTFPIANYKKCICCICSFFYGI